MTSNDAGPKTTAASNRQQVRSFVNAMRDAITHAGTIAGRASEAFDGSDECVVFHKAMLAILAITDTLPEVKAAMVLGLPKGR